MFALLLADPYVDIVLALGLAFLSLKIVQALFGPLGGLPVVGGAINSAQRSISQSLSNACGHIASGVDHAVGGSLHAIARLMDHAWRQFRAHASAIAQASTIIGAIVVAIHALRSLVHHSTTTTHGQTARLRTLERELHGIEKQVKTLEHDLSKGIGEDVLPRLRHLDRELHRVTHRTIPAIEAGEATNRDAIGNVWDWLKRNVAVPGTAVFTGAVAVALSALGLGWLRCDSNPFNNNKNACGLWGDLSSLLGIAFIAAEVASLDELIGVAQTVTEDVITGVEDLLQV